MRKPKKGDATNRIRRLVLRFLFLLQIRDIVKLNPDANEDKKAVNHKQTGGEGGRERRRGPVTVAQVSAMIQVT